MKIAYFFILIIPLVADAQNYVRNGSFETLNSSGARRAPQPCRHTSSPDDFNYATSNWSTFNVITPDLLTDDTTSGCTRLPKPKRGIRMAGLIMFHPFYDSQFGFDYHEFLQGTLAKPLEKGKTYRVSCWTYTDDSLGLYHLQDVFGRVTKVRTVRCNNFGFYFSETAANPRENFHQSIELFGLRPQINVDTIVNAKGWTKLTMRFTADRPYKFFVFGNFFSDPGTDITIPMEEREKIDRSNDGIQFWNKTKRIAYYLFDDFAVVEDKPDNNSSIALAMEKDKKYVFSAAVLFQSGQNEITAKAHAALNELADYLTNSPNVKLDVVGHTDNVGDEAANQELSERRARAVCHYLEQKGIAAERLKAAGYGETQPVADNNNESGKAKNRRVEVAVRE